MDACLSMYWADYRKGSKKAKVHSSRNGAGRPFVNMILSPGQTGVTDRGYQAHDRFGQWEEERKHFVSRIKAATKKTVLKTNEIDPDSNIFYDTIVLLVHQQPAIR